MTTLTIEFNGSKWADEEPDSIDILLQRLETDTLDPKFEHYGNFVQPEAGGVVRFFGNFSTVSHAFGIVTDDSVVIDALVAAIKRNQASDAYRALRKDALDSYNCRKCWPDKDQPRNGRKRSQVRP
jgi:hypothetical protein